MSTNEIIEHYKLRDTESIYQLAIIHNSDATKRYELKIEEAIAIYGMEKSFYQEDIH